MMQQPDPYAAVKEAYNRGVMDALNGKTDLAKYLKELDMRPLRAYFSS